GRVVEDVPTSELADRAAHPYTRALLSAIPDIDADRSRPLAVIAGRAPDPSAEMAGCAFAPRCPLATSRCDAEAPSLATVGRDQRVACWNIHETLRGSRL